MKVTIEKPENEKQEIQYPCLMRAEDGDGRVVLFSKEQVGVLIMNERDCGLIKIGEHCTTWSMQYFTPLPKGSKVIIEQ